MMKIGFVLPANMAFAGPGNGVRVAADHMADALARAGHDVARLEPWQWNADRVRGLDVVQVFLGSFSNFMLENTRPDPVRMLSLMPTIDSNEPNWRYRLAASLGNLAPRIYTVAGEMRRQALNCELVVCRSSHERARVIHGLGVDPRRVGVEVVRLGVNPPGDADPEGLRKRLGLPGEFVLHVSAYAQPRKNVERLIEALGPTGLPLVIAGTPESGRVLDR